MKIDIQCQLTDLIQEALVNLGLDKSSLPKIILDFPSSSKFGDLSTNIALQLSKLTKKTPNELAFTITESLREKIQDKNISFYIKQIKVEGPGFINFYLADEYFYSYLKDIFQRGKSALRLNVGKNRRVLIEFVSANPTGPLSVAHARQAAVGDALANILGFMGFKVKREYYLNDEGNQINILGRSIALRCKELMGEEIIFPADYYQGEYIKDIARQILEKKIKVRDFSEYGMRYILNIIKKELEDFGVRFDYWCSQKKIRQAGKIKKALGFLKKKGFLYEYEGALWFKSSQFGDDKDRVVVKSNGSYTYLAPDIAYHQQKYNRGFNWLIDIWGPDHHGYINRLRAAVKALGKDPDSLSIIIVQLATIFKEGKPLQMSTRKGQYITLREVLDEVGRDASRFFFLMRRTSSHLDFDLEVAKRQTPDNPVYYVQYAHARICSILENSSFPRERRTKDIKTHLLKELEEIELIKKLWQFPYILNICIETLDPYMVTVYLQELAQSFHRFYDRHRVLGQSSDLTYARLVLIEATRMVISTALELLGISAPEKM